MKARGEEKDERGEGRRGGLHPMSSFDFHVRVTEDLTFKKGETRRTQTERDGESDSDDL